MRVHCARKVKPGTIHNHVTTAKLDASFSFVGYSEKILVDLLISSKYVYYLVSKSTIHAFGCNKKISMLFLDSQSMLLWKCFVLCGKFHWPKFFGAYSSIWCGNKLHLVMLYNQNELRAWAHNLHKLFNFVAYIIRIDSRNIFTSIHRIL